MIIILIIIIMEVRIRGSDIKEGLWPTCYVPFAGVLLGAHVGLLLLLMYVYHYHCLSLLLITGNNNTSVMWDYRGSQGDHHSGFRSHCEWVSGGYEEVRKNVVGVALRLCSKKWHPKQNTYCSETQLKNDTRSSRERGNSSADTAMHSAASRASKRFAKKGLLRACLAAA